MRRIAYLQFDYLPLSEVFIYDQIKNIKKFEVIVICAKTENLDQFPYKNIKSLSNTTVISYLINRALLKYNKSCPYFSKIIKQEDVSLIHAPFGWNGLLALPYKVKFGIPLIASFYGHDVAIFKKHLRSRRRSGQIRKLFVLGDWFLVEGEAMKRELIKLGCPKEKILVHHLGINLERFKFTERKPPGSDEKIRILMIARFVEKKGIPDLIRAFAEIRKRYSNVELRLVGDGPMEQSIKSLIKSLDISDDVTLCGFKPFNEIPDELLAGHIFVHPSREAKDGDTEGGAPTILFAAQATGLPVISTYHADIPEVVLNGKSGYLVNEGDVVGLAERINYLVEHPDLWIKLGWEGRRHIEKNYDITTQVKKLEEVYKSLI